MRPLHGLLLLLVVLALLVGGLFWFAGDRGHATVVQPAGSETTPPADKHLDPVQLSATDAEGHKDERGAVDVAGNARATPGGDASAGGKEQGLFGRVVGPDGKGVAAATVYAAPADGFDALPLDAIDPKLMPWAKRSDATTDGDGRFRLDLASQAHVKLAVRAPSFAPLDAQRTLARGERDLGDVALEPGVVLRGRVSDPTGRPVAGAELFSRPRTGGFAPMMDRGRVALARTDAAGQFKVDMLASGPWRLLVSSEDHPDKTFNGETDRPGAVVANLDFALDEGAQIQGRVTGAGADVLAKLTVSANMRNENEDGNAPIAIGPDGFTAPRRAKVGADGAFVLRGLKPAQGYRLNARETDNSIFGGFGMGGRGGQGVNAKSGDRGVEVPYTPEGAIVCQVVDATTGAPVTEMDVKAGSGFNMPLMDSEGKQKRKFADGKVRFDRLPPRMGGRRGGGGDGLKLRIDATGYKTYESSELNMVQGQDLDLGVIKLERAPVCRVKVLDLASGAALAGAEVTLREAGQDNGRGFGRMAMRFATGGNGKGEVINDEGLSQGTTGADGTVVLSSFPGKQATLKVTHPERATYQSPAFTLANASDDEQTVKLGRGGDVLVQVVDSQGKPVASVEVEHSFGDAQDENPWMRRIMGGNGETKSDARGEVLFAHLEAGAHRFRLASDNGSGAVFGGPGMRGRMVIQRDSGSFAEDTEPEPEWTNVEVSEGGQGSLRLVAPARATVAGRVREGGKALAGASLSLTEKTDGPGGMPDFGMFGGQNRPKSNGSGEYKIENVKPGKYVLRVTHPSRSMPWETDLEVREGESRFDVELPIGIVEGRITGPDGKPIAGARVRAERYQEQNAQETQMNVVMAVAGSDGGDTFTFGGPGSEPEKTDADGRYTLRGVVTDADLLVRVTGKDVQPASSEKFRVAPDQTVRGIDLKLKQGGSVEVSVMRAGQPVRGVMVNATRHDSQGGDAQSQSTGPNGIARFSGLEPGKWDFNATDYSNFGDPNNPPTEGEAKTLEVEVGKTAKQRFDLP